MEFRDALKALRSELGVTQAELAASLHVNYTTINRWETGKSAPNRSTSSMLLDYARARSASKPCCDELMASISDVTKQRLEISLDDPCPTEHAPLIQLIDNASFPLYVCDLKTDELLYINRQAETLLGGSLAHLPSKKCYVCFMHRDTPCEFCQKERLTADDFTTYDAFRPDDQVYDRVLAKLISWNGRRAQVRIILDMAGSLYITSQKEREISYREQLRIRRESVVNATATAYFNLTHNSVIQTASRNDVFTHYIKKHSLDEILAELLQSPLSGEDQSRPGGVFDRASMIQLFYAGKTHISIKHRSKRFKGYFESTFDLIQNPLTYDIEAFAALWDITDATMASDIADRLFHIDYESIIAIDAETGEPHPYVGNHIKDVIAAQKAAGNTILGVEEYLRKHCVDDDLESVILGTNLQYVKEQLADKPYYHIAYTLKLNEKLLYKRTMYTYLDQSRTVILCAMQDLTDIHALENVKRGQIAVALRLLQEQAGMNVARYDLNTGTFYSNSEMVSDMGFGKEITNVPEAFIEKGLIEPTYIQKYREFYMKLKRGEASTITVPCRVMDGSFHWLTINAHLVFDRNGKPYQAVLSFRDVDHEREQAAVYQTWRQSIDQRAPHEYTLLRCNLTKGITLDKVEGQLLRAERRSLNLKSFNERVRDYASKYVHIEDFDAYTKLLNSENLLAGYLRGVNEASLDFRDLVLGDAYRWLHLSVKLAQQTDSSDVEAFIMYEHCEKQADVRMEAQAETLHRTAFENTGLTVVKLDCKSGAFTYDPAISKRILGEYDQRPLWEIFLTDAVADAQDVRAMRNLVSELASNPDRVSGTIELQLKTPSKIAHWFNFFAVKQFHEPSGSENIVMTFLDIHDDVLANQQLRFQAEHDCLTGLYNRASFLDLLTKTTRTKPKNSYVLLCGGINDFHVFSDRYGRAEGDRLLRFCADRLHPYVEAKGGFDGRVSNDAFAALLPNAPDVMDEAQSLAQDFFQAHPTGVKLTVRVGAYVISDPDMKADEMLDMAAAAKESIRDKRDAWLAVFDERMNEQRLLEKRITERMEAALAGGEFSVFIQPQFHHETGRIVGAEALARWADPERGEIAPDAFIPIFEKNGFITRLDEFVREKAAQYASAWMAEGGESVPLSVNVSGADIDDPGFCRKLLALVERHSIPRPLFRLEITESLFAKDPEHLARVVRTLREAGFPVVMDNFGSGYSSLNVLRDVPVDILKLDMRFLYGDDNQGRGGMIINAMLRMSHWLGIPAMAVGVEKPEQADFLMSIGCHTIQGFLYEKPMPADRFAELLSGKGTRTTAAPSRIDTKLDKQEFWDPLSADSKLFYHYIGPAVVFEYHGGECEIVRVNKRFADAARAGGKGSLFDALQLFDEEKPRLRKAILETILTQNDTKVDVHRSRRDGIPAPMRITLRILAKGVDRALIMATLDG